jgi:hypothetical protein
LPATTSVGGDRRLSADVLLEQPDQSNCSERKLAIEVARFPRKLVEIVAIVRKLHFFLGPVPLVPFFFTLGLGPVPPMRPLAALLAVDLTALLFVALRFAI